MCVYENRIHVYFFILNKTKTFRHAFFFQAEDGIRDKLVTGVQTCALPISSCQPGDRACAVYSNGTFEPGRPRMWRAWWPCCARRSEERRVGKECRSRW